MEGASREEGIEEEASRQEGIKEEKERGAPPPPPFSKQHCRGVDLRDFYREETVRKQ